MLRINFLFPMEGTHPIGGYKVAYEFANYLSARGHRVRLVHAVRAPALAEGASLVTALKHHYRVLRKWFLLGRSGIRPDSWFQLDSRIAVLWRPSLSPLFIPDADFTVATAWNTAERLPGFPAAKGRGLYLVQNDERLFDGVDPRRVERTWRLGLNMVVTGTWLAALCGGPDAKITVVGQGVDYAGAPKFTGAESKIPRSIIMMYHGSSWKRSADGIAAIRRCEERIGPLHVTLFSVYPRPAGLPAHWCFLHAAPQAEITRAYAEAAVFLSPSLTEGFALPPCEAMLAGCGCVLTRIGGHLDAGIDRETAVLCAVGDIAGMADALVSLLENEALRRSLAENARRHIAGFTWARAGAVFERALLP